MLLHKDLRAVVNSAYINLYRDSAKNPQNVTILFFKYQADYAYSQSPIQITSHRLI